MCVAAIAQRSNPPTKLEVKRMNVDQVCMRVVSIFHLISLSFRCAALLHALPSRHLQRYGDRLVVLLLLFNRRHRGLLHVQHSGLWLWWIVRAICSLRRHNEQAHSGLFHLCFNDMTRCRCVQLTSNKDAMIIAVAFNINVRVVFVF